VQSLCVGAQAKRHASLLLIDKQRRVARHHTAMTDLLVEAAWPPQRCIEGIRAVRGRQHDCMLVCVEVCVSVERASGTEKRE
jgi:hypothetical protein